MGLGFASISLAAGFGVSGEQQQSPQAAAISQLLTANQKALGGMIYSNNSQPTVLQNNQSSNDAQSNDAQSQHQNSNDNNNNKSSTAGHALGDTSVSQQAFMQTVRNMMPLSPAQIKTLHDLFNRSQKAASTYPGTPPRPTSSTVLVNLSPGSTPPVIRLRAGYVTSLVFLDSTGQPWPITAYDLGDPQAFNIEPNQPDGTSDTLLVEALDTYKEGNLAVMLKGENTPIMLTLMPGQKAVDYRVDLRVPGMGPNAKPNAEGLPSTSDPQLVNFLDGVPPSSAKALQVSGGDGTAQAWIYNNKVFLRTRYKVLSPSWLSSMSSPDGTHVYELPKAPVVLASLRGAVVQLMMKGL